MNRYFSLSAIVLLVISMAACQTADEDALVVYSGRSQALVDGLVEQYEEETGNSVEVRYGRDAELLAALQEEGDQSSADVLWANTAGALGAATEAELLTTLPDSLLQKPADFTPPSGRWVPVTTRFRVLAYNPERVDTTELPASVMDLPEAEEFAGRIGWTPTYSSFQDFVSAMRAQYGADSTRAWLEAMQELDPNSYTSNTPMIQALTAGEIDIALTNHYYILRARNEGGENGQDSGRAPVDTYHFAEGDVGNLALVTGAGVLQTSDQQQAAQDFLNYLLSQEAQGYAAETIFEYPVVPDAEVPGFMLSIPEAMSLSPDFDYDNLRDMEPTLNLMRDVGVL